jgi:hypothetical protein
VFGIDEKVMFGAAEVSLVLAIDSKEFTTLSRLELVKP